MSEQKKTIKRKFNGIIVSDKMDKTVVVKVDRVKLHSKYHKRYTVSKNYKAHDEKNEYKIGDKVVIQEVRPLSKDKKWRVIEKVGKGLVVDEIKEKEMEELDSAKRVAEIEQRVEKGVDGSITENVDGEKDN
ncbi:30S ribosomal protein S17 [Candidatus Falkowbacteria bacterium]|nr:30S ribosomal protein S17 [Candidatus Falkowbacteria bacterium]